jgi:RNA polymerase sigma-32 factor
MLEVGRIALLTREEEKELAFQLSENQSMEAAQKLVAANLRFVVKIAFEYKNYNIRMTDLIQEGNVGLMHAVSKFDPERGYRLISYAVWWIKAYIQNYIIKNWSMVPISARRKQLFGKRSAAMEREDDGTARLETDEAHYLIAAETGKKKTLRAARKEMEMARRDFSLDTTLNDDGTGTTHVARLASDAPSAEETLARTEARQQVHVAIASIIDDLDHRALYILEKRLISDDPMSLTEIGKHFGISRERARQLEARIKTKLKKALSRIGAAELITD